MERLPLVEYRRTFQMYFKGKEKTVGFIVMLIVIGVALKVVSPLILKYVIDSASNGGDVREIRNAAILYIMLALVFQAVNGVSIYSGENLGWLVTNRLRNDLTKHCLHLDMGFHKHHSSGEMIERLDGDVNVLANFLTHFVFQMLGNFLLLVGILLVLFREGWWIGTIFVVFSVMAVFILNKVRDIAMPHWVKAREASANFYGFIGENVSATEEIKSNNAIPFVMRKVHGLMRILLLHERKAYVIGRSLWPIMIGIFAVGYVIVLGSGSYMLSEGLMTLGSLYLMYACMDMLRSPLELIAFHIQDFQKAGAAIIRVRSLMKEESKLVYEKEGKSLGDEPLSVTFDHVSFSYDIGEREIIKDVSFTIAPGKTIGLLGRTGSGKTTLSRLLFRLYDPTKGMIRIGGMDVKDISHKELSNTVGFVTQEVRLFHATVRENITLFKKEIEDEKIWFALHEVGLGQWASSLQDGLDTIMEANHTGLSAGQEQLLSFARILLRDPKIIVLDEATSRLDPVTEKVIDKAMDKLLENRTAIIIAHRLETVKKADEIVILDDGILVEHGEVEKLMNDSTSRFYQLNQVGKEVLV